jgi:hypothetical protein
MATTNIPPAVGLFADRAQAEQAVEALHRAGFAPEQIGVVVRDGGTPAETAPVVDADVRPEQGAAAGAVTGGVLGTLLGAGIAMTLPVVGPALALGVLAGALGGATLGITGGGLVGALLGLGISQEEASYYQEEFVRGRTLVTVRANGRRDEALAILKRHGALERAAAAGGTR